VEQEAIRLRDFFDSDQLDPHTLDRHRELVRRRGTWAEDDLWDVPDDGGVESKAVLALRALDDPRPLRKRAAA
jgi:hypothetical protein